MQNEKINLILASRSPSRSALLRAAGLKFDIKPADVDEPAIRAVLKSKNSNLEPADIAEILARSKAEKVSAVHPDAMIIGADQVLSLHGKVIEKPHDMSAARKTLNSLVGQTHSLHACVCVARNGQTMWTHGEAAHLTVRDVTPDFLERYLLSAGETVLESVGAYKLEAEGVQLFSELDGDYFTILGLPLLALLDFLRQERVLVK